ncbi:MAG TPA: hypothetical protein VM942_11180, partial [Acidimicrobiales bacterium]|nr:hypothetical protein [Acidimicrobiales bacterium]
MSTTYPCETCGSQSATSDYCDTCGAAIQGPAGGRPLGAPTTDGIVDPPDIVGPSDASSERPVASSTSGATCYFCGAPRAPGDETCDVCGVDFESGRVPAVSDPMPPAADPAAADPTPAPPAPMADLTDIGPAPDVNPAASTSDSLVLRSPAAAGDTMVTSAPVRWTALVGADRAFFAGNVTAGVVAFPEGLGDREVPLVGDEVSIGRRSESKGYFPDIDLSAPVD